MKTYSSAELKELATGVFVDDPKAVCVYADENGTFKNAIQYEQLPDEEKAKFEKIDNPNIKPADYSETEEKLLQVVGENAKLKAEVDSVKAELDTTKAELESVKAQLAQALDELAADPKKKKS